MKENLCCSFCGTSQKEVKKLIAGPKVYICNQCVELCNEILIEEKKQKPLALKSKSLPTPEQMRKN